MWKQGATVYLVLGWIGNTGTNHGLTLNFSFNWDEYHNLYLALMVGFGYQGYTPVLMSVS